MLTCRPPSWTTQSITQDRDLPRKRLHPSQNYPPWTDGSSLRRSPGEYKRKGSKDAPKIKVLHSKKISQIQTHAPAYPYKWLHIAFQRSHPADAVLHTWQPSRDENSTMKRSLQLECHLCSTKIHDVKKVLATCNMLMLALLVPESLSLACLICKLLKFRTWQRISVKVQPQPKTWKLI